VVPTHRFWNRSSRPGRGRTNRTDRTINERARGRSRLSKIRAMLLVIYDEQYAINNTSDTQSDFRGAVLSRMPAPSALIYALPIGTPPMWNGLRRRA